MYSIKPIIIALISPQVMGYIHAPCLGESTPVVSYRNNSIIEQIHTLNTRVDEFIKNHQLKHDKIDFSTYSLDVLLCVAIQLEESKHHTENIKLIETIYLYIITQTYGLKDYANEYHIWVDASIALGKIYLRKGEIDKAEQLFSDDDQGCKVLEFRGDCKAARGKWEEAFRYYQNSYDKAGPHDYNVGLKLSDCYNLGCGIGKDQVKAGELRMSSLRLANLSFRRRISRIHNTVCLTKNEKLNYSYEVIFRMGYTLRREAKEVMVPNSIKFLALCKMLGLGGSPVNEIEYDILDKYSKGIELVADELN